MSRPVTLDSFDRFCRRQHRRIEGRTERAVQRILAARGHDDEDVTLDTYSVHLQGRRSMRWPTFPYINDRKDGMR